MKRFFPFLRGKQNELMALRELAPEIAERGKVIPVLELVNQNSTTRISIDRYIESSMPFVLLCNPANGSFSTQPEALYSGIIAQVLTEYDNWTPAYRVQPGSSEAELSAFVNRYGERELGIVYQGVPTDLKTRTLLKSDQISHHIFLGNRAPAEYIEQTPRSKRVLITDRFNRCVRNADYPPIEFFTDMNTVQGNPDRVDFGDFSVAGDQYSDSGGPALAVALHHIHFHNGTGTLDISHFISNRTETTADVAGKTLEALNKLVEAIENLSPNDTSACNEYREIAHDQAFKGLGYMKRLAIKHHLEVMLGSGIQL